jgi:hypothetical protein
VWGLVFQVLKKIGVAVWKFADESDGVWEQYQVLLAFVTRCNDSLLACRPPLTLRLFSPVVVLADGGQAERLLKSSLRAIFGAVLVAQALCLE